MQTTDKQTEKVAQMSVASVYPHYVTKIQKKGRTIAELEEVICWLTGFDAATLQAHLEHKSNFQAFFAAANLNPKASLITGTICGYKIEAIEQPLMRQVRYLDKLVDELAKGKSMEKILRK